MKSISTESLPKDGGGKDPVFTPEERLYYTVRLMYAEKKIEEAIERERMKKVYDDSFWWAPEEHREFLRNYQVPHPDAE